MKIVVMTQVYNENRIIGPDGKTNIERFMESVSKYCDGLIVFDDGSTDDTRDVITSYSGDFELEIPSNPINSPENENYHRARSLQHAIRLEADWVVCLDPDEVLESRGENGALRALLEAIPENVGGVGFYKKELWRSDRYVRVDYDWAHRISLRAFRPSTELKYNIYPCYRTALAPLDVPQPFTKSSIGILHYAYINDNSILAKYNRWKQLGIDISEQLDDSYLRITDSNPTWFGPSGPIGRGIDTYDLPVHRMLV